MHTDMMWMNSSLVCTEWESQRVGVFSGLVVEQKGCVCRESCQISSITRQTSGWYRPHWAIPIGSISKTPLEQRKKEKTICVIVWISALLWKQEAGFNLSCQCVCFTNMEVTNILSQQEAACLRKQEWINGIKEVITRSDKATTRKKKQPLWLNCCWLTGGTQHTERSTVPVHRNMEPYSSLVWLLGWSRTEF